MPGQPYSGAITKGSEKQKTTTQRVQWSWYSTGVGVRPRHSHSPAALAMSATEASNSIAWYSLSCPLCAASAIERKVAPAATSAAERGVPRAASTRSRSSSGAKVSSSNEWRRGIVSAHEACASVAATNVSAPPQMARAASQPAGLLPHHTTARRQAWRQASIKDCQAHRADQNRSCACVMRKTSSRPSGTPSSVCIVGSMDQLSTPLWCAAVMTVAKPTLASNALRMAKKTREESSVCMAPTHCVEKLSRAGASPVLW
mmetsp:Transcript_1285/g.3038  ORF Transcript_1285/g.3038 Transcript_1285/m.3038 type:complete len:259 (-) Transcript_1285:36-812(-)